MTNLVRIVAAIVDTHTLTLYKQDGTTVTIPQGDPRVRQIVTTASPQIIRQGYADVDLSSENDFQKFEEETKGSFKFFKVAKDKLRDWFGKKNAPAVDSAVVGHIPRPDEAKEEMITVAVEDILKHAVPVASPEFTESDVAKQRNVVEDGGHTPSDKEEDDSTNTATHTIIAVTPTNAVVPGVEKIKTQFSRALKLGSTKAVETFLERVGKVAAKRSHSIEDLLKFMERGDLPIAEDGSILIYKVLNRKGKNYVDCHSKKVEQWVGAYVHMDESLVDHNRNNECSNGLHVARRGYIRQFSGDVCTLCKVAPEDVIAVPSYDANKMRVCGYHILFELTDEQYALVKQNKPISDIPSGAELLAKAIAGKHIGITHKVKIGAHMGGNVTSEEVKTKEEAKPTITAPVVPVKALDNPMVEGSAEPVAPKAVAEEVKKVVKEVKKTAKAAPTTRVVNDVQLGEGSPRERIQKLLALGITSTGVARAIMELKKKSKKSWTVLGVSEAQVTEIVKLAGNGTV